MTKISNGQNALFRILFVSTTSFSPPPLSLLLPKHTIQSTQSRRQTHTLYTRQAKGEVQRRKEERYPANTKTVRERPKIQPSNLFSPSLQIVRPPAGGQSERLVRSFELPRCAHWRSAGSQSATREGFEMVRAEAQPVPSAAVLYDSSSQSNS